MKKYCKYFGVSMDEIMKKPFKKLAPATSRPYANLYTPNKWHYNREKSDNHTG